MPLSRQLGHIGLVLFPVVAAVDRPSSWIREHDPGRDFSP
ncbi:hypothetical protein HMPREF9601_02276 [Cutibacterium acnes HL030PA1]|nr:hypothetical protein HMPREF9603_01164 [Cutibacterium acnes HL001PA1]EFT77679.1 hypothetical protein HMPREF9601_02276 [Cutibacterium acnes HL030PA1]